MDIEDLAILGLFILKDSLHGSSLHFKIGSQTPDFRSFLFWVRKYENACHPFHCLQGKRFLALKLLTSFFTAVEDFCMTRLCLRKTSFRAMHLLLHIGCGFAYFFICLLK